MKTATAARPAFRPLSTMLAPLFWLERAKGRKRTLLLLVYLLIGAVIGLFVYRATRLSGLPDIADPFDRAALTSTHVPDERNAFVLYAQARLKLVRNPTIENKLFRSPHAWPTGDAGALAFLQQNDEALDLWLRGTERPDAMVFPIADLSLETQLYDLQVARPFYWHARTRASGCIASGDMAGAWKWYRGILRATRHCAMNGPVIGGILGTSHYGGILPAIKIWAADPRVDVAMLKGALRDVKELNAMTTPFSQMLCVEYLSFSKSLADLHGVEKFLDEDPWGAKERDKTDWTSHVPGWQRFIWFANHEPERSQRIIKLAFANWLAQIDKPAELRPPMVGTDKHPAMLYDAPAPPGSVSTRGLAERLETAIMAPSSGLNNYEPYLKRIDRDKAQQATLVIDLASQIYEREQGKPPATAKALVGTYLDRLPEGHVEP